MNEQNIQETNRPQADPKKIFNTIDGNTLMLQEYEPLQFAVENILPHGLFIMAGSGKIGKSWLSLDIGTAVATGGKLWDFAAEQGEVLYLALEDTHQRLQGRLEKIEADNANISRLHLTTAALGIGSGLIEQTHNFLTEYPNTKLIIVDTLERIRDTDRDKSMYSCDYRDMTALREITNRYNLTLLLVHHTRKMYDPDPLNTLSGSTGLVGSVDGVFVLEKLRRVGNRAKLTIANRDTESFCFRLDFDSDKCKWVFMGNDDSDIADVPDDDDEILCLLVDEFLKGESWRGTATELCQALNEIDGSVNAKPSTITKRLNNKTVASLLKDKFSITVNPDRKSDSRAITIMREAMPEQEIAS